MTTETETDAELLARLEAVHAAATQGEWALLRDKYETRVVAGDNVMADGWRGKDGEDNAAAIAAAHNAMPRLLELAKEALRLREVLTEVVDTLEAMRERHSVGCEVEDHDGGMACMDCVAEDAIESARAALGRKP